MRGVSGAWWAWGYAWRARLAEIALDRVAAEGMDGHGRAPDELCARS